MLALLNSKLKEYNIHGMLFLGWGLCDGGLVVVQRGGRKGTVGWGLGFGNWVYVKEGWYVDLMWEWARNK